MKSLGLGALAWNPLMSTIASASNNSFEIKHSKNLFIVYRKGRETWVIDKKTFGNGVSINVENNGDKILLRAGRLRVENTTLYFDFNATIEKEALGWRMRVKVPQFNIDNDVSFADWLDGYAEILSKSNLDQELMSMNGYEKIELKGDFDININNDWKISLNSKNGVVASLNNNKYYSDKISINPKAENNKQLVGIKTPNIVEVVFDSKKLWKDFIKDIRLPDNQVISAKNDSPEMHLTTGTARNGKKISALWAYENNGLLNINSAELSNGGLNFTKYIFFSEFFDGRDTSFRIKAKMGEKNQWIASDVGSFCFSAIDDEPELEISGTGNSADEISLEPGLKSFQPDIIGAVTLPVIQDTVKTKVRTRNSKINSKTITTGSGVRIKNDNSKTIESQSSKEKKVREASTLDIQYGKVKFRPKRALKIRILRPDDLLWLDFDFHNFVFVNKGQGHFVELANRKKKGVLIIHFPTQHTIEEAYYETNANLSSGGSNDEIKLPARHLRAHKSRLVYELPKGHAGFPLTLNELLDWSKFKLRVHPRAWLYYYNYVALVKPKMIIPKGVFGRKSKENSTIKYLDYNSKNYAIKLSQANRNISAKNDVYDKKSLEKVLKQDNLQTLQPSFNILKVEKIIPKPGPVDEMSTCIEAPALLYISPNQMNDFYHKNSADYRDIKSKTVVKNLEHSSLSRVYDPLNISMGKITELWHTTLGVKLKNGEVSTGLSKLKTIRALWAYDANTDYTVAETRNAPFRSALDANNRQKLVHTTSNFSINGYTPIPVPVNKLMLTSLGAYLDWHVFFNVPKPFDGDLNIIEWQHLATLGRDHYVKIVEKGNLFPFGHRAAIVTVTERKFDKGTRAAVNRQRKFIVVLQKDVSYDRNNPDNEFIKFPFQQVSIDTKTTPNIDKPEITKLIPSQLYNFLINVGGKGFLFDMRLIDKDGKQHYLRMPLAFIENKLARDKSLINQVITEYHKSKYNTYTDIDFDGQDIAYSPNFVDGDTAFETQSLLFGAEEYPAKGESAIKFHPVMRSSKVYIKQVDEMTGVHNPATITLVDDINKGMVFAEVSDAVVDFSGNSDKAGGFLSPNMAITALSKLQGPVGGNVAKMKDLIFDPEDFFSALESFPAAKIFGVIKIFDLLLTGTDLGNAFDDLIASIEYIRIRIEEIKNEILFYENQVKKGVTDAVNNLDILKSELAAKVVELLDALNGNIPKIPNFKSYVTETAFYAEYKWQPEFKSNPIKVIPGLLQVNVDNPQEALTITTKVEKPFDASKPAGMSGVARFDKFGIDIVPLLEVNFNYLEFKTGSSTKTAVKVDIDADNPIEFKGVLSFVNNLQSIIPSTGFSDDGPYIELKPTGVKAGFDLSIPNVEVGICMISNISLGAYVMLPFTGAPLTLGFNFCKRENPFMLTISCFGGGGFFMLVSTLQGIQSIEAAFEFGAALSLNVGVASGGVSAMGGIYYKVELVEDDDSGEMVNTTTLTGYLRINGHLSVLGLITISMEFYLAFTALITDGKVEKLEGMARVKVKVEILFFSKTVTVTVRRELKGADADPKFIEMIDEDDWSEYCLAFAS